MSEVKKAETLKKRVEVLEEALTLVKKDKSGIIVPIVLAVLGLLGTLGAAGITAWSVLVNSTPISCADERDKAAKVYKDNPNAWIDYSSTDKIQAQCQINEYIEKIRHP